MSYDYPEPTEEELLRWMIEEDAADGDLFQLWRRQQDNWDVLIQRVEGREKAPSQYDRMLKDFNQHKGFRAAQWWDLVTIYPELHIDEIFGPDWEGQIESRTDYDDVHSLFSERVTTLVRDHRIWLELKPLNQKAWLELMWQAADKDGIVRAPVQGPGWWQTEPDTIQMRIQKIIQYHPVLHVLFSVQTQHCPPVAGRKTCWLPSLIGYEEGAA